MTDFDTDWDINKYYDETEPEEHWELRKEFMLAHKTRFTEDYLVALARTFTNIEFMGCSYNRELMTLISDLSKEVADSYRKQKKTKLQRTFVKASDAAESKFSVNKKTHTSISSTSVTPNSSSTSTNITNDNLSILQKVQCQPGFRGKIVLVKHSLDEKPWITLHKAATMAHVVITVKITGKTNHEHKRGYNLVLAGEVIADGFANSEKDAKEVLAPIGLQNLQKTCFTIERKVVPLESGGESVDKSGTSASETETDTNKSLPADNIGAKLMKLMGWSGKGLGKDEDGREDCIDVKEQVSRMGFGGMNGPGNEDIRKRLSNFVADYAHSDKTHNLIFSAEFSTEERKYVHSLAAKYNLKSRSYGKDENRQLVVSRKITAWEIVRDLLEAGGSTAEYNLTMPTDI